MQPIVRQLGKFAADAVLAVCSEFGFCQMSVAAPRVNSASGAKILVHLRPEIAIICGLQRFICGP